MHSKKAIKKILLSFLLVETVFELDRGNTHDIYCATRSVQQEDDGSIHFIALNDDTDAILIECNGKYGMVDSGEDNDYPDGSDSRYPLRSGVTKGQGHEQEVISYLRSLGVNSSNFEFYIGTHPHSDHIGSADEIIYEFHPQRVYAEPYDDSMITAPAALWDNQYVYDHMIEAANETGAKLIQHFNVVGDKDSSSTFHLGGENGLKIEILNYGTVEKYGSQEDANNFSLGVKVTSEKSGKTAFLSGDINNYNGTEDQLAKEFGHVDLLKLGHHGNMGSNTDNYISTLNPEIAVLTGTFRGIKDEKFWNEKYTSFDTALRMAERGTPLYCTAFYSGKVPALVFQMNKTLDHSEIPTGVEMVAKSRSAVAFYKDGFPTVTTGWKQDLDGAWYYFNNSKYPIKNQFIWYQNNWYYLTAGGNMATGWQKTDGLWYYFSKDGQMLTGWQYVSNHWYYMGPDGSMVTKWKYINGHWYYLHADGDMATGWEYINGHWYFMNKDGDMATGWKLINWRWYYLNRDGNMATGWIYVDGHWYYLNSDGSMAIGWNNIGDHWYYMNSSGEMQANRWISGIYYVKGNGVMATSEWVDNGRYYVGADGSWIK